MEPGGSLRLWPKPRQRSRCRRASVSYQESVPMATARRARAAAARSSPVPLSAWAAAAILARRGRQGRALPCSPAGAAARGTAPGRDTGPAPAAPPHSPGLGLRLRPGPRRPPVMAPRGPGAAPAAAPGSCSADRGPSLGGARVRGGAGVAAGSCQGMDDRRKGWADPATLSAALSGLAVPRPAGLPRTEGQRSALLRPREPALV